MIAFTTAVAEHGGPSARWLHFGMTSSDVIDTATRYKCKLLLICCLKALSALLQVVRGRADEHRRTQ
ncbi:MAG: hypothetical protein CM1200mP25_0620 [Acidobacteriota bacterium]|nr:MAG: hypothetical protein CM1200mP25_0620 [Acidobacteriota bacterium]